MTEPTTALEPVETVSPGVSATAAVDTWPMWVFVLLPGLQLVQTTVMTLVAVALLRSSDAGMNGLASLLLSDAFSWGSVVVLYGVGVLLAVLDWRMLERMGIPAPLSWKWGFLQGVYLIGRGVVLRRRIGRGMRLTWIGIVISGLSLAASWSGLFEAFLIAITS